MLWLTSRGCVLAQKQRDDLTFARMLLQSASATASSNPEVTEFQKLVMGATFARRSEGRNRGPAEAGPIALICDSYDLISDCALPALLQAIFSRHRVFEEILVLRCEAFRKLENLKAVAIADGPELDIG